MFWFTSALLILIAAFLIARPLLAKAEPSKDLPADHDVAVFKDQLTELEEEFSEGLLDRDAHDAAKLEIQRRLLTAASSAPAKENPLSAKMRRLLAALIAGSIALGGVGLYLRLGQPGFPDQPFIERLARRLGTDAVEAQHQLDEIARLTDKLAAHPDDAAAWRDLGRAQRALARHPDGAESLRQALVKGERDAEVIAEMAESQVYAAQGEVSADSKRAFETVLIAKPDHPKALYFLGQERMQANDPQGALKLWRRLESQSAPDAPWLAMIRNRIAEAEGILSGKAPVGASGAPDVGAMVAKLEARLKANPNDAKGWSMLGRSYAALGEIDKSRDAYGKAAKLVPTDLELKQAYAVMIFEAARQRDAKAKVPQEAADLANEVLKQEPKAMDALFLAGQAALDQGRKSDAKGYWTRLLEQLEPASPDAADLKKMIDGM
jgi:cytochrome c-type biogenesis protein CcmH